MIPATVKSSWGVKAEAMQVTDETAEEVAQWCGGEVVHINTHVNGHPFVFHAIKIPLEVGVVWARRGDFVIRWPGPYPFYSVYPLAMFSEQFTYE